MTLKQLKQEARGEFYRQFLSHDKGFTWDEIGQAMCDGRGADFLDTLIDKVVDAVETHVYQHRGTESESDYNAITEAFRNFKGV